MTLTILEVLYIVLIMFSSIIGTLIIIMLMRVIRILGPIMEIVDIYNKVKDIFKAYASIPDKIKENFKDIISNKKDK